MRHGARVVALAGVMLVVAVAGWRQTLEHYSTIEAGEHEIVCTRDMAVEEAFRTGDARGTVWQLVESGWLSWSFWPEAESGPARGGLYQVEDKHTYLVVSSEAVGTRCKLVTDSR